MKNTVLCFEKEFGDKNITLITDIHEQNLEADKDKITQVILNLISNALKYTPEGGTITISTSGGDNEVEFSIQDTGIGISKEDLPYIFERFYRVDKSRSRATGGSGIGLAIAKTLVKAHEGTISVKSEQGFGSEFVVTLPR